MLLLKLTLAPFLVAAATLIARKWGAKAGGLLMGLPLTTGPIFLFLAVDQGPRFAARALVTSVLVHWTDRVVTLRSVPHKVQNS
jgi:hypothetical protein